MKSTIVAVTKPLETLTEAGIETLDHLVAYFARVSNPTNQHNTLTSQKLLNYLEENKHWSPFEMVNIVVDIETTRDVAMQILRHRSMTVQMFSERYAEVKQEMIFRECRMQDPDNRQNSLAITNGKDVGTALWWQQAQREIADQSLFIYQEALKRGIAKEVARVVLPSGMTPTRLYVNGTLRSWMHYFAARADKETGTQKEHQELAQEIKRAVQQLRVLDLHQSLTQQGGN
jgi:thymidylate synthase (FAD)